MYLFQLFRSFLPLHNPIGFGAADFLELALALLFVACAFLWRPQLESTLRGFSQNTRRCMLVLFALPIVLRLILILHYPIPTPEVSDDFSYLLIADTLRHFRLANPTHPMYRFFETYFVLQQPTYSSIFPLGQGILLAFGWTLFGHPWVGVAISVGALSALCFWMLRGWTTPGWALLGGALAVIQFGPLNQWMNSYWGGALTASAGCLVFGALPRLRDLGRTRDAILLGIGLGIHLLTRPYESIFLFAAVLLFRVPKKPAAIAALTVLPACGLMLVHNKSVTRSWTTLPYAESQYQYGVPASFTFQPVPKPHREMTPQQQLNYDVQSDVHNKGYNPLNRIRFYRFFFLPPLFLAIPFFLLRIREYRFAWVILTILLFAAGTSFYPYFYSHYIAALTCLFVLVSVMGLERMRNAGLIVVFFCVAHFVFWYSMHLFADENFAKSIMEYETWDAINSGDRIGRAAINHQLSEAGGKHLVFVRYTQFHQFHEWVHNAADIDQSPIIWARDRGPIEDEELRRYYPDRKAWLLEADALPPKLVPYH